MSQIPTEADELRVDYCIRVMGISVPSEDASVEDLALFLQKAAICWDGYGAGHQQSTVYLSMLREDPGFLQVLRTACMERKFTSLYGLYRRKTLVPHPPTSLSNASVVALAERFEESYRGTAALALKEYMREANKLFHSSTEYFGKFLSVCQSSGTGKSRMITELSQNGVLLVYICLRPRTDNENFPVRDDVPANILLDEIPDTTDDRYLRRCYLFIIALLITIREQILTFEEELTSKNWNRRFGPHGSTPNQRSFFFNRLLHHYNEHANKPVNSPRSRMLDERRAPGPAAKTSGPLDTMAHEYNALALVLAQRFPTADHEPQVVIAFDEAQTLSSESSQHGPIHSLCRALSDLSLNFESTSSFWVVFASTAFRAADFAFPRSFHESQRVAKRGNRIFPPFTLTNWDVFAPNPTLDGFQCASRDNVGRYKQLAGFGRPLWHGFEGAIGEARLLAQQKLMLSTRLTLSFTEPQALAILGQRFGLEFTFGYPGSTESLGTAVSSHMRVCLSITRDGLWRTTNYPSEPILSDAAATLLHRNGDDSIEECLKVLNTKLRSGMIDKGQRGEMVSCILLLLGRDAATPPVSVQNIHLKYCQPIRLLGFLKVTFGSHFDAKDIATDFSDAWINTSHWVSMKENIVLTEQTSNSSQIFNSKAFLLKLWLRTAGIQCAQNQFGIHKVWPMYFDDDSLLPEDRMAPLVFSDKLSKSHSESSHQALFPWNVGIQLQTARASVVVTCDMGVSSDETVVSYETETAGKCLKIYVQGTSSVAFPFLAGSPVEGQISLLTEDAMDDVSLYPVGVELAKKFEFARNSSNEYTDWWL